MNETSGDENGSTPFFRPPAGSPESAYLAERLKAMGGSIPERRVKVESLQAPALEHATLDRAGGAVGIGHEAQEAVLDMLLEMRRHEGALALSADQQVLGREFVDRLAHRALAHTEARGQLHLARNGLARTPFARLQALGDQGLDLLVERAERRTAGIGARRCGFGGRGLGLVGHARDCNTSPR